MSFWKTDKHLLIWVLLCCFATVSCHQAEKPELKPLPEQEKFINPPIVEADVPFIKIAFDNAKGDTLFYQTRSIILFPAHAFVDKNGNSIQGDVEVRYRELTDPIDFYLSGIPMVYDSAGGPYNFKSSGMCEIYAYKDGVPVYINQKNKPELFFFSNDSVESDNLYALDTVQRKWIYKGTNLVMKVSDLRKTAKDRTNPMDQELVEPVRPGLADNKSPVLKIVIDPASFKELSAYNNLRFQLMEGGKPFNTNDTSEEWNNIDLQKANGKGLYTLRFSKSGRSVSYLARPVLEGKDYDKALQVFDKENKAYRKNLKEAMKREKQKKREYLKDSVENLKILVENKRMERLNALVDARNRKIDELNEIIEKQNGDVARENKEISAANRSTRLIRSLVIDGFGVLNCDYPFLMAFISLNADFKDEKGDSLSLTNIAVLVNSLNSIIRADGNFLHLAPDTQNMIVGVYNGRFAYTIFDPRTLGIDRNTGRHTFIMTVVSEKDNNYGYIKKIAERE